MAQSPAPADARGLGSETLLSRDSASKALTTEAIERIAPKPPGLQIFQHGLCLR